jgi:hypothetical protein
MLNATFLAWNQAHGLICETEQFANMNDRLSLRRSWKPPIRWRHSPQMGVFMGCSMMTGGMCQHQTWFIQPPDTKSRAAAHFPNLATWHTEMVFTQISSLAQFTFSPLFVVDECPGHAAPLSWLTPLLNLEKHSKTLCSSHCLLSKSYFINFESSCSISAPSFE